MFDLYNSLVSVILNRWHIRDCESIVSDEDEVFYDFLSVLDKFSRFQTPQGSIAVQPVLDLVLVIEGPKLNLT